MKWCMLSFISKHRCETQFLKHIFYISKIARNALCFLSLATFNVCGMLITWLWQDISKSNDNDLLSKADIAVCIHLDFKIASNTLYQLLSNVTIIKRQHNVIICILSQRSLREFKQCTIFSFIVPLPVFLLFELTHCKYLQSIIYKYPVSAVQLLQWHDGTYE